MKQQKNSLVDSVIGSIITTLSIALGIFSGIIIGYTMVMNNEFLSKIYVGIVLISILTVPITLAISKLIIKRMKGKSKCDSRKS